MIMVIVRVDYVLMWCSVFTYVLGPLQRPAAPSPRRLTSTHCSIKATYRTLISAQKLSVLGDLITILISRPAARSDTYGNKKRDHNNEAFATSTREDFQGTFVLLSKSLGSRVHDVRAASKVFMFGDICLPGVSRSATTTMGGTGSQSSGIVLDPCTVLYRTVLVSCICRGVHVQGAVIRRLSVARGDCVRLNGA